MENTTSTSLANEIREKGISPEQQEQIKKIEKLRVSAQDKASLVLLVLGEKQIAHIGTTSKHYDSASDATQAIADGKIQHQELMNLYSLLGLAVVEESNYLEKPAGVFAGSFGLLIAKKSEDIEQFQTAKTKGDHAKMGRLFGFPETAVLAYGTHVNDVELENAKKEMNEVIEKEHLANFLTFTPSLKFWRQELDAVRKNKEYIKLYAPELYTQIMLGDKYEYPTTQV